MANELIPTGPGGHPSAVDTAQFQAWAEPRPEPSVPKSPIERPLAAIRRYKWLIVAVIALAIGGGVVATRFVTPEYEVRAAIMIALDNPMDARTGPIRSGGLLIQDDWTQLLKSSTIADAVVRKLSLYVVPDNPKADAPIFSTFGVSDAGNAIGAFELTLNQTRKRWVLTALPAEVVVDSGGVADSVGVRLGFHWILPRSALEGAGERTVKFTVLTAREVASKLRDRLGSQRGSTSNFLFLTLQDRDSHLAATILNTWAGEYVNTAAALKKRKLADYSEKLGGQLQTAKAALAEAELQLSNFRIKTIVEPHEGTPIAAGLQETRDPVMKEFFDKTVQYDQVRHDVELLQSLIANLGKDSVPGDAFLQIRTVASEPAAQALRTSLTDYHAAETELAKAQKLYTDENPIVKGWVAQLNTLRKVKIPQQAAELLRGLETRAHDDSLRIASQGQNLRQIPQRTSEEERLRRARDLAAGLFTNLDTRYAEAQLAEASATPDVSILDSAIAPLSPTKNTAPRVMLMAIAGGIGAALALAILLDRLDARFRYPEQATDELGLTIAGTVPRFPKGGISDESPEQMFQLVESFRSLRMTVLHATGMGPVSFAVSSPSPSEGKSLISANLAMSFADAGVRTVLVDGDTRRGALNEMFEMSASPGLTDYLAGVTDLSKIVHSTRHESLHVIPCGRRNRKSPELLTSTRLPELIAELQQQFDAVIFDTPPLAAGVDGYSIAAATGNLLVVLRVGQTARRMAAEKIRLLDRLPVNVIGAVLNGIRFEDGYAYYGYVAGYEVREEQAEGAVVVQST